MRMTDPGGRARRLVSVAILICLAFLSALALGATVPARGASAGNDARDTSIRTQGLPAANESGKVLLVVIDRIGINDLAIDGPGLPNLRMLMENGATGLMNARVRYGSYGLESYVAIGASGRVLGVEHAAFAFSDDECLHLREGRAVTAADEYTYFTDRTAVPGTVINLAVEEMKKESVSDLATSSAGLLGQCLREAGGKVCVVGNADFLQMPCPQFPAGGGMLNDKVQDAEHLGGSACGKVVRRQVSCIAMDADGTCPGDVSSRLHSLTPSGLLETDFDAVEGVATAALADSHLVVVDTGETSRVDQRSDLFSERRLVRQRRASLEQCDRALGSMLLSMDLSRDLVIVCAPTPTSEMIERGELLTPLVVAGPGFSRGGHLRSGTTRRTGLVSNYDIAPTILGFLGVEIPGQMEGRPIESVGRGLDVIPLQYLRDRAVYYSSARNVSLNIFVLSAVALFILLLVLLWLQVRLSPRLTHVLLSLLFAVLWAPFVYLVLPLLPFYKLSATVGIAIASDLVLGGLTVLIITWFARGGGGREARGRTGEMGGRGLAVAVPGALVIVLLVTLAGLSIDSLLGSSMIPFSPFGATLTGGGRYYGIGNVYMGAALAASILAGCLIPTLFPGMFNRKWKAIAVAAAVLLPTVAVIGSSRLGANVGGLIAGAVAAFFTLAGIQAGGGGWKRWVQPAVVVLLFLLVFFSVELLLPGPASHAGRVASRVEARGAYDLFAIVARKLQMNWKLFWVSMWRIPFFLSIALSVLWLRSPPVFKRVLERYPSMRGAWIGMAAAVVAGITFNDTGIETAGAIAIYFVAGTALLYLAIAGSGWRSHEAE